MSQKQIDKRVCPDCESEYKVIYETASTSGFAKFCPFCGEEHDEEEVDDFEEKEDD